MLLTPTHSPTLTHTPRVPLSSQQFSKSSGHWKFRDWCQPHSQQYIRHFTNSFFCPNRNPQLTEPGPGDAAGQSSEASNCKRITEEHIAPGLGPGHCQSGDFTRCLGARDELWTSLGWAHLVSGGTSQQEQGSLQTLAGDIQPAPVLWQVPGTQVRLRAQGNMQ